jgi:hypothetical protein
VTAPAYSIRPPREDERAFVLATFVNGWAKNQIAKIRQDPKRWAEVPYVYRSLPIDAIAKHFHARMTQLLEEGHCLVAGDDADDSVLMGYVVFDRPNTLHWCWVKPAFEEFGVQDDLLNACCFEPLRPVFLPNRAAFLVRLLESHGLKVG